MSLTYVHTYIATLFNLALWRNSETQKHAISIKVKLSLSSWQDLLSIIRLKCLLKTLILSWGIVCQSLFGVLAEGGPKHCNGNFHMLQRWLSNYNQEGGNCHHNLWHYCQCLGRIALKEKRYKGKHIQVMSIDLWRWILPQNSGILLKRR